MGHDTEWCATTPSYDLYPKFGVCKGFGYNKLEELSSDKALSKGLLQVTRVFGWRYRTPDRVSIGPRTQ